MLQTSLWSHLTPQPPVSPGLSSWLHASLGGPFSHQLRISSVGVGLACQAMSASRIPCLVTFLQLQGLAESQRQGGPVAGGAHRSLLCSAAASLHRPTGIHKVPGPLRVWKELVPSRLRANSSLMKGLTGSCGDSSGHQGPRSENSRCRLSPWPGPAAHRSHKGSCLAAQSTVPGLAVSVSPESQLGEQGLRPHPRPVQAKSHWFKID